VLLQWSPKGWQPLSFYSKKIDVTQKKYSTFDRELLAVNLAVRHFRFLLEGWPFHVKMDHKSLTFALHRTSKLWSARQQRHLSYLAEFTSDIQHVSGQSDVVANALSRPLLAAKKCPPGHCQLRAMDHHPHQSPSAASRPLWLRSHSLRKPG
jgi:hypothetical protein